MDFIPFFKFVMSLIMFGLLFYVYNPIITYLDATFPTSGIYATVMFFLWGVLAGINVFGQGIKMIMEMQRQP